MKKTVNIKSINKKTKRVLKADNTVIAKVLLDHIVFQGDDRISSKISDFYERFISNFERWTDNDFYKYARNNYDSDDNPRKKFRFSPFILTLEMTNEQHENNIMQTDVHISLYKNRNKISTVNTTHIWDLSSGVMRIKKTIKKDD